MQLQFVDQAGSKGLLRDAGTPADDDVLGARDLARSVDRRFDAVDELEARRRIGLILNSVGHDDARPERRAAAHPSVTSSRCQKSHGSWQRLLVGVGDPRQFAPEQADEDR